MRIGFLYGVHGGDEPLSIALGRSLEESPIKNVFPYPGNERAIADGGRYSEENLAFSMRHPDRLSRIYERRRAAEIIAWAKHGAFDALIDFHTARYPNSEALFASKTTSQFAINIGRFLQFRDVIVGEHGIQLHVPEAVCIDAYDDPAKTTAQKVDNWRREVADLANYADEEAFTAEYSPSEPVRFWNYSHVIATEQLRVPEDEVRTVIGRMPCTDSGYVPLDDETAQLIGIANRFHYAPHGAVAINFGLEYVDLGIVGEVLQPLADHQNNWYSPGGMANGA